MSPVSDVVLIDPFGTLGSEISSQGQRFHDFSVYPSARALLERLRPLARLGVFSLDTEVPLAQLVRQLSSRHLTPPIERELVAVAERGDRTPFAHLLAEVGLTPDQVVFVALDAGQRARAIREGLRVAPHLALAESVLAGHSLRYVRLSAPASAVAPNWADLLADKPVVPVFRTADGDQSLYVIASSAALTQLSSTSLGASLAIEPLGAEGAPSYTTLYLLQVTAEQAAADDDLSHFVSSLAQRGFPLVEQLPGGWLVALPGTQSLDELHPPPAGAGHGHTRILLPSSSLLKPPGRRPDLQPRPLRPKEQELIRSVDAAEFQRTLRRFE